MPLLWLSLAFLAGILLAGTLNFTPAVWWACASFGAIGLLAERTFLKSNRTLDSLRAELRLPVSLLLLALALGGLRYQARQPEINENTLAYYNDSGTYTITARISAPPDRRADAVYLVLSASEIEDPRATDPALAVRRVDGKLRARFAADAAWLIGDVLRFEAALLTPAEGGSFSYKDYLARQGISSVAYSPRSVQLVGVTRGAWFSRAIYAAREHARQTIFTLYPQPESGLLAGILLGLDHDLPKELEKAYQETGTAHIIAISGFNMAVLAYLFVWFFNRVSNRYWAVLLSSLLIGLYAVFVGGAPSVVRAAIMAIVAFGGQLIGRRGSGLNALMLTAALMCLFNPSLPWDVSFQLSFAATLGLVLFAEPLRLWAIGFLQARLPEEKAFKYASPLSEYFLFTLAAQLVTLPLIAWHFGRIPYVSLLANPLVLPAQPPLLVLSGISAVAGSFFASAGKALALFAWPLAAYSNRMVVWLAGVNSGSLAVNHGSSIWLLVFVLVFILLFIFRGYFKKIFKGNTYWLIFLTVLAGFSLGSMLLHRPDGRLHLTLLRGGDESVLMLRTPDGRTLVFDPGADVNELAAGVSDLLSPWRYHIDEVWFTRSTAADNLGKLHERLPVKRVVLAPPTYMAGAGQKPFSAPQGMETVKLKSAQGLRYPNGLEIRIAAESHRAAALLISYGEVKVLIPNGVDYTLIKAANPDALHDLSLLVVGEEDLRYIPARVWQDLLPTSILWNSAAVAPVEGWLNLEDGAKIGLFTDGFDLFIVNR